MLRTALAVPLFFWAWTNQHKCHRQLAGLKKYSIPQGGMFDGIVCPHYTCECLIYLSLAILAAPPGRNDGSFLNQTLLCAVIFVVINLGVTAYGTRRWYEEKFGPAAIQGKWNMIPFLF
jgi:3-oxo-5-alpha-steroid 4-dehydrogenase 3